jgi:DNA-directed RNA polymerase specialized sigma24 family protein
MSPEKKRDFESEWPSLARRLRSFLGRKKVPASKQDDLIQETALRLYKMWDSVDRNRPAWALTVTIALNLLRDEYRRAPHSDVVSDLPDIPQSYDVERAGIARMELGRVRAALAEMSPAHRLVLLAEVGHGGNVVDAGDKMRRMRARRKLTEILERVSAIFVLPARRLSDLAQAIVGVREGMLAGVSCILCTVLGIGVAVSVPLTAGRAGAATLHDAGPGEAAAVVARSIMLDGSRDAPVADAPGTTSSNSTTRSAPRRAGGSGSAEAPSALPKLPITTDPNQEPPSVPLPGRDPRDGGPVPVPAPPPAPVPVPLPTGKNGGGQIQRTLAHLMVALAK